MTRLPLQDIRVADFTVVWAGPYGAQLLADWGAEVIRVEPLHIFQPVTRGFEARPSKDTPTVSHRYPGNEPGARPWNRDSAFNVHARNKLSMTLDLRQREGKEVLERLVRVTDVVLENNPISTLNKLGVTYQWLRSIKPDIIMIRMPPFGLDGPYKDYRTVGSSLEAVIGHTGLRGYSDTDPTMTAPVYAADAAAGPNAAFAVVGALYYRHKTGKGQLIDMAQSESMIPYLGEAMMDWSMNRRIQRQTGNLHPSKAPHGCYPCKGDDRWIVIAVGSDEEWKALCRAIGDPSWAKDTRFATCLGRWHHQGELEGLLAECTREREAHELMRLLQKEGVAAGPVVDEADLLADPHLRDRGFYQELTQSETGTYLYPGPMWRSASFPNRLRLPPCRLGEHNEYVYGELLGYGEEEYRKLEAQGQIGMDYPLDVK